MGCGHSCARTVLPAHLLKSKTCRTAEGNAVLGKSKRVRARRTIDFKCNILSELMALESRGIPAAATLLVSMRPGLSKQILSGWKSTSSGLFSAQSLGQGHLRNLRNTSRAWYSKEEDELYVRFIFGREVKGFKLDDTWLQDEMESILEESKPDGWDNFKCSPGWLSGFKKRYRIQTKCEPTRNTYL